jgi:hypothetical protein
MVLGFDGFKKWFEGYDDQFVIIGGVAGDILMSEDGRNFRATKDIDMVLLVEILTVEFGVRFWDYVREGGYRHRNKSGGEPQFYRFTDPGKPGFPYMIELFSRRLDSIPLPADAVLTPLPLDDDLSSLSAILVDDDYYGFLLEGRTVIDGVPILGAAHLIPFKAKAWLDLSEREAAGNAVDSKNIRKHKNDVFRLSQVLPSRTTINIPGAIKADMADFCAAMDLEDVDTKALGLAFGKDAILGQIRSAYSL